jgi:peroxiredoxin
MTNDSLSERLAKLRAEQDEFWRTLYDGMVQHLVESATADDAIRAGDTLPDFQLPSADGRFVRRADVLAKGPAVINFYRGAWCPFCSAELNALANLAPEIAKTGAALVAITPEAGGTALRTKIDRDLPFEILCDLDNVFAMECGLVFPMPDDVRKAYVENGLDFARLYGNDAWLLPIPATYIVKKDATIAKAFVEPDFRHRLDPAEILRAIDALT